MNEETQSTTPDEIELSDAALDAVSAGEDDSDGYLIRYIKRAKRAE